MSFSSLHVCMDSSDWIQSSIYDESGLDSSSPSGEMLACSRPLIERRLRPPHDEALRCPRCDSTHTKFCYYNNYSLSQPRYYCKTCRRYWTQGGTLRNIPVGGGCRRNKKASAKKPNDQSATSNDPVHPGQSFHHNHTDLQLSFPAEVHHLLGTNSALADSNFTDSKYSIAMLERTRPTGFMDSKYEGIIGNLRNYDFNENSREHFGLIGGIGDINSHNGFAQSYNSLCSPSFGMANNGGTYRMDSCQRLMLPYDANEDQYAATDVKPNPRLSSLAWQDHGKDSFGYLNGLGSWTGMTNANGSSSTNPLV